MTEKEKKVEAVCKKIQSVIVGENCEVCFNAMQILMVAGMFEFCKPGKARNCLNEVIENIQEHFDIAEKLREEK